MTTDVEVKFTYLLMTHDEIFISYDIGQECIECCSLYICQKFNIYFMVVVVVCAGLARAEGVDKINASLPVPLQDNTLPATLGSISCPSSVHFFVVMTDDLD